MLEAGRDDFLVPSLLVSDAQGHGEYGVVKASNGSRVEVDVDGLQEFVRGWLAGIGRDLSEPNTPSVETALQIQRDRGQVERLVHVISLYLEEHDELLRDLANRDATIDQLRAQLLALQAQRDALHAELQQKRFDRTRSSKIVEVVVAISAAISAVTGVATMHDSPPPTMRPVTNIVNECNVTTQQFITPHVSRGR